VVEYEGIDTDYQEVNSIIPYEISVLRRCSVCVWPQVSWHRNDEQLLEGKRFHFVHEGNFFCVDVAPVMVEDGGRWTCMAEGAGGRTSCSSNLNVLGESEC
jgi:hypothetical protein